MHLDKEPGLQELSQLAVRVGEIYAQTFGIKRDATFYLGKLTEELGELSAAYLKLAGQARGDGGTARDLRQDLEDELADLLGFVLLFADWQGIDPGMALRCKWGRYLEDTHDH